VDNATITIVDIDR